MKYTTIGAIASASAAGLWLKTSQRRSARLLRRIAEDAKRQVLPAPVTPTPSAWSNQDITICWLGHSTTLINFYGINILTDPALGNRVGISLGLGTVGPKRYISPALSLKQLPPIDVILLSHGHMDHMDLPTLKKLAPKTFTVTAKLTREILAPTRLNQITELAWGESTAYQNQNGKLEVEAFEVKHWGERWPSDVARGYNGYVLKREGKAILFAGDTANTSLLGDVRSKGPFEAALMPIGAYRPWIWNHCNPEQAVEMANAAGAKYIVPIHHKTFRLSDEPMNEPIERLSEALHKEPERIALRNVGEHFVCSRI